MSNKYVTKCDQCGKTVDDKYAEHGWYFIESGERMRGREPGSTPGNAKYDHMKGVDFCTLRCMVDYLNGQKNGILYGEVVVKQTAICSQEEALFKQSKGQLIGGAYGGAVCVCPQCHKPHQP